MMMLTKRSFDSSKNIRAASIGSPAMLANKKLNINSRIILSCYSVFFTYSSTRNLIAFSCIFLSFDCYFLCGHFFYTFLWCPLSDSTFCNASQSSNYLKMTFPFILFLSHQAFAAPLHLVQCTFSSILCLL